MGDTSGCPTGAHCLVCRGTDDLRPVLAGSPAGPLCWTACAQCAHGGVVLRLTAGAGRRMVIAHRGHAAT